MSESFAWVEQPLSEWPLNELLEQQRICKNILAGGECSVYRKWLQDVEAELKSRKASR